MARGVDRLEPLDSAAVPRFAEIATFMRFPHAPARRGIDVGLVGVPFDAGATNRSGARHGPAGVREASRTIRRINPTTGVNPSALCAVADLGDVACNPVDLPASIASIERFYAGLAELGIAPVTVGGDHTITYPILKGLHRGEPVGVVHFDSHADTLDELLGTRINHGTPFRRAVEDGAIDPRRMVQVGLRGTRYGDDDLRFGLDAGMRLITMDEYEAVGRDAAVAEMRRVVGAGPTYVTFDIDGLDPCYAIGTGTPEPGGLTMRDAQMMLRGLTGLDVVGGDVVEVAPPLDPTGITALSGANLLFEITCLVAAAVARRRAAEG